MPVYEYQGKHYELSTTDPSEAKSKIMSHLGVEDKPQAKDTDLTGLLKSSEEKFKKSPLGRMQETFEPVKAITEEGILPQLYQAGKRMVTGEKPSKAEEPPEKPTTVTETLGTVIDFAKKDPGAFAGAVANAVAADPEFLLMPEFLMPRVVASLGRVGKVVDAATQASAMAAGQSAARQLNERGKIDMNVLRQDVKTAAVISGGGRVAGEAGRAAFPGVTSLPEAAKRMVVKAKQEGYTIPARELSPLAEVIDKFYKTPLRERNTEKFVQQITEPTGTTIKQVNPTTLPRIGDNLSNEVKGILVNEQVIIPSTYLDKLKQFVTPQKGSIDNALAAIEYDLPISGESWHDVRKVLNKQANAYAKSGNTVTANDVFKIIDDWDAYAEKGLTAKAKADFDKWRGKYTAYKDIYESVLNNKTAYGRYLKGELNPEDLMSSIRLRRESEAEKPFRGRPQTKAAALGSGLDLLGYKEPVPYDLLTTVPKLSGALAAKPAQAFLYSKPGQELLYRGLGQTRLAPYLGPMSEKVAKPKE
jgi:hypothetical protein